MPTRTIVHLSSTSIPGGAEMIMSRLAGALSAGKFRSVVCLFSSGWLQDRCIAQGLETHVIPINGIFDRTWGMKFFKFLKTSRANLVHAHEFTANTQGAFVARLAGIPVIATIHGKSYYGEQIKRRLAYRLTSRIATTVAVSEDLKRFIVSIVGISPERIRVIYNGVPDLEQPRLEDKVELRRELRVPPNHQIVGVIGSLYPVKGHTYLLQSIPAILKEHGDTVFFFAGRGELEEELKRQARDLGIQNHVRILGFRNDVANLLGIVDLFVLPSLSEGLSVAILEAMVARKPVVASNVGGNPELVVDGETGYLVPPMSPPALSARIVELLGDQRLRSRLGEAGRRRATELFSLSAMVDQYERLYAECMDKRVTSRENCADSCSVVEKE